jgi:hypothetical protein
MPQSKDGNQLGMLPRAPPHALCAWGDTVGGEVGIYAEFKSFFLFLPYGGPPTEGGFEETGMFFQFYLTTVLVFLI